MKHLLQRTLNRCNLMMEISNYQAAAILLELPLHFSTEKFAYVGPQYCINMTHYNRAKSDLNRLEEHREKLLNEILDLEDTVELDLDDNDSFLVLDSELDTGKEQDIYGGAESKIEEPETGHEDDADDFSVSSTNSSGDAIVHPETFGSFGLAAFHSVEDNTPNEPVFYPELYDHRGKELAWMNREEFYALMRVEKIEEESLDEKKGKHVKA